MLGGASRWFAGAAGAARIGRLLQTAQAVVDRGLRKLHPPRQLAQVQLRMLAPPAGHLAQGRGKALEPTADLEPPDRSRLAETRSDRLADVRRFEVEPAVHLAAHLAHHPHALELHDGAAGAPHRKKAHDRVNLLE